MNKGIFFVLLVYLIGFALLTSHYFMDDAYIGFVYARNLAAGEGLVFYPGLSPVEGITNLGWIIFLSFLTIFMPVTLAAKVLGALFLFFSFLASISLMRRFSTFAGNHFSSPAFVFAPALLLLANFDYMYFGLSGMETAFLAALLLLFIWEAFRNPASFFLPVLGGLAFLVRPEAGLVYPFYFVFGLIHARKLSKRDLSQLALWFAFILGITLFRWFYFGALLPNTFSSKSVSALTIGYNFYTLFTLKNTNFPFPYSLIFPFCLPFIFAGAKRALLVKPRAAAGLLAVTFTGIFFALYAQADWTFLGRYFVPYLPAFLILLWLGLIDVLANTRLGRNTQKKRAAVLFLVGLGLLLVGLFNQFEKFYKDIFQDYPGYVLASQTLMTPSLWISNNTSDDAIIATRRIGSLAYFSNRRVFDYKFGLPEPAVTALIQENQAYFDNPAHPLLSELWQGIQPDYILEDESVLLAIAHSTNGDLSSFQIHGIEYIEVTRFLIGRDTYWVLAGKSHRP
jgi:hypothetical protein